MFVKGSYAHNEGKTQKQIIKLVWGERVYRYLVEMTLADSIL